MRTRQKRAGYVVVKRTKSEQRLQQTTGLPSSRVSIAVFFERTQCGGPLEKHGQVGDKSTTNKAWWIGWKRPHSNKNRKSLCAQME